MIFDFEEPPEERLFKAALGFSADEREQFIRKSAGEDLNLAEAALLLLQGYSQLGGDGAEATMSKEAEGDKSARKRWATFTEEPGATIGAFTLVRKIGEGGMGTVWEAEQKSPITRRVALKLIKLGMDTAEIVKRFERERQTLAILEHPNIAAVYEAGATDLGRPFFAMEFVEGKPITDYATVHGLSVENRLSLVLQVCSGIEHAHRKGIIHRDLKPSNVLVNTEGIPKVIDFGIAKAATVEGGTLFTQEAQMLGTPAYMSPEQATGNAGAIDTRSDVYSLGVVLYELLAGAPPFDPKRLASTGMAEIQKILSEEEPPKPSTRQQTSKAQAAPRNQPRILNLGRDLDSIVMKAIAKEPERRYQSTAAFGEDLQRYLDGEVVSAVPPSSAYRLGKFVRRNRLAVAAASMVILSLLGGLVVSFFQVKRANAHAAAADQARTETTYTVADLYTNSGLAAADDGAAAVASLWFANAAVTGAGDPDRLKSNLTRARAWRDEYPSIVRAMNTGFRAGKEIQWHPGGHHLMVTDSAGESMIISLETELPLSFEGAAEGLKRAQWSHDGMFLVGDAAGSVVVLAFPSGELVAREDAKGTAFRWSPDDQCIAVAGGGELFLWLPFSSQRINLGSAEHYQVIEFSPDGEFLLLHGDQATVRAIAEPTVDLFAPVEKNPRSNAGFLGPSSHLFYLGQTDLAVEVRDARSGNILESYTVPFYHEDWGATLAASPDGFQIAIAGYEPIDRRLSARNAARSRQLYEVIDWHPSGKAYIVAEVDVHFGQYGNAPDQSTVIHEFTDIKDLIVSAAYSPNGEYIAAVQLGGLLRVWNARANSPDPVVDSPYPAVFSAISPDGKYVLPAGTGRREIDAPSTRLYDLVSGEPAGPEIISSGFITHAAFSQSGQWCALGVATSLVREDEMEATGHIEFWDPFAGRQICPPLVCPSEPRGLAMHPDANTIAVVCRDGEVVEIDFRAEQAGPPSNLEARFLFKSEKRHASDDIINTGRCRYSEDGRYLVVFSRWHFHLWDRKNATLLDTPTAADSVFDIDMKGSSMAVALTKGEDGIGFWDLSTGRRQDRTLSFTRGPWFVRFDEGGSHVLTNSTEDSAQVFDIAKGQPIGPACPHGSAVFAGDFIDRTPWIAAGSIGGYSVRFWDSRTGFEIRPPISQSTSILGITYAPESRRLVVSAGRIRAYAQDDLFPEPTLEPAAAVQLAELDSSQRVRFGGGLDVIQDEEWTQLWRSFRRAHPDYPGHLLNTENVISAPALDPAEDKAIAAQLARSKAENESARAALVEALTTSITVTPVSVETSTSEDVYPVSLLIDDSGLSAPLKKATDIPDISHAYASVTTAAWATRGYAGGYFDDSRPAPVLTFALDKPASISGFVYWGYVYDSVGTAIGHEPSRMRFRFFGEDGEAIGKPVERTVTAPTGTHPRVLKLPATPGVKSIKIELLDNFAHLSGGDRVGLGEVRFLSEKVK